MTEGQRNREEEDIDNDELINQKYLESDDSQPPVDFVLYLQQTGSIIALARLMDALDEGHGFSCDSEKDIILSAHTTV